MKHCRYSIVLSFIPNTMVITCHYVYDQRGVYLVKIWLKSGFVYTNRADLDFKQRYIIIN